jgi:hypothetical protein
MGEMVEEAERAANQENMMELYNTIRKLSGKYGNSERPVKDKEKKLRRREDRGTDGWKTSRSC